MSKPLILELKEKVELKELFASETGVDSCQLSESSENFDFLDIVFIATGKEKEERVYNPNTKSIKEETMQEFVRGDTFAFKFLVTMQDGTAIQKEDIDTLFITCRKNANKESPIIFKKTLEDVEIDADGYCHAIFNPEDTQELIYGSYFFDIEVTLKNGYRKTKLFKFEITKETTIHESGGTDGS